MSPLTDQVLEVEPWNSEWHPKKTGEAWVECGRRVPGLLKEGTTSEPRLLVQKQILRMGYQLYNPRAKVPWKSCTEVKRKVEELVTKLSSTWRYKDKFPPVQQQGPAEPKHTDGFPARGGGLSTAHATVRQSCRGIV